MRSRFRSWSVVLGVLWLAAGGCYWLRYDALARTHVDLLVSMVTKLQDVTAEGEAPARMAEYRYPLDRARDFVRIVEGRFTDRASLQALRALCDAYERTLEEAAGGDASGLEAAAGVVRERAAAVVAALDREAG